MSLRIKPLNTVQLVKLNELLNELSEEQIIWMSGYLEGKLSASTGGYNGLHSTDELKPEVGTKLTILYGTETGNANALAEKLVQKATFNNVVTNVYNLYDYNFENLSSEKFVALIVSTHGEGDPPDMAEEFYKYVMEGDLYNLNGLNYTVLALGDKSYKYFCKTGEDLDNRLKDLGATAIIPLVKCDVEYEMDAEIWMNNLMLNLKSTGIEPSASGVSIRENLTDTSNRVYSKKNPFQATVLEKEKISGNDSEKEVYHLELSIENSGLTYEPGDSVGIFTKNPDELVDKILEITGFDPEYKVEVDDLQVALKNALTNYLEITVVSFDMLYKYFEITKNKKLGEILENDSLLDKYLFGSDVLDVLNDFPFEWNIHKFIGILRKMPPRLYSISSCQDRVGDEIHATIKLVQYEKQNRKRTGACTSHVIQHLQVDDKIPVYIEKNQLFKLPPNGSKIIMVGAGTGIAPYRAFMQAREFKGLKGDSWLFYGDQTQKSDFLYEKEWQRLKLLHFLEKMDVAFSRDQKKKVYVQHKLKENEKEIYEWLENGAFLYICGDKKKMAKEVHETLVDIIQKQGGITTGQAEKYLKNLKREKRLQTDVY